MQGIQKLWFKVILVIQTEVQTNITRQDRSILLFKVFVVGNVIPYHCLLNTQTQNHEEFYEIVYRQWIQLILFFTIALTPPLSSWSSTLTTFSTSEKRNVLVPLKATQFQLWDGEWRGRQPWNPTALTASCQTMGEVEAALKMMGSGPWLTAHLPQQPTRGIRTFPFDDLVN